VAIRVPYRVERDGTSAALLSVMFRLPVANPARMERPATVVCLIDSGATRCMFSGAVAKQLGIELKSGVRAAVIGIGGEEEVWFHDVILFIPGGPVKVQAGFQENLPVAGLLGMSGFFEHFRISFDGAKRQCEFERIFDA
jgi:hypothetical protein